MSVDLVQIRWQQIRFVEALQVVERENFNLRKQLAEAKNVVPEKKIDPDFVRKVKFCFESFKMKSNADLVKLKNAYNADFNELVGQINNLREKIKIFTSLIQAKDNERATLKREIKTLTLRLEESQKNASELSEVSGEEQTRLRGKITKLKQEIMELEIEKTNLVSKYGRMKDSYDESVEAKLKVEKTLENSILENKKIADSIARLKEEHARSLEQCANEFAVGRVKYEQLIEELGMENQYLRGICAEQEDQIQRLSSSLIGNKSHFAKYVEVKTENLNLQSKLEQITSKKSENKYRNSLLAAGSAVVSNNGTRGSIGGSASMLPSQQRKLSALQGGSQKVLGSEDDTSVADDGASVTGANGNGSSSARNAPLGGLQQGINVPRARPPPIERLNSKSSRVSMQLQQQPYAGEPVSARSLSSATEGKQYSDTPGVSQGNTPRDRSDSLVHKSVSFQAAAVEAPQGGQVRKSMRLDSSACAPNAAVLADLPLSSLSVGVPLLNKQTRESLKSRLQV